MLLTVNAYAYTYPIINTAIYVIIGGIQMAYIYWDKILIIDHVQSRETDFNSARYEGTTICGYA